jgi:hypothetical protein
MQGSVPPLMSVRRAFDVPMGPSAACTRTSEDVGLLASVEVIDFEIGLGSRRRRGTLVGFCGCPHQDLPFGPRPTAMLSDFVHE